MNITRARMRRLRELLVSAAESLPDEEAVEAMEFYNPWQAGTWYDLGTRLRHEGQLYRCEQAHTSQEGWEPDKTPAIWTPVAEPGEISVWRQPMGAQDAYRIGDKVHYPTKNDPVYVSTIDYNTYAPDVYGWELYEEESNE